MATAAMKISVSVLDMRHMVRLYVDDLPAGLVSHDQGNSATATATAARKISGSRHRPGGGFFIISGADRPIADGASRPLACRERLSLPVITAIAGSCLVNQQYAGRYQAIFRKRHQYRPDASRGGGIFQL